MKCPLQDVATENQGTFTHLRLVGPSHRRSDTLEWIFSLGGHVISSGPYTNRSMFPKVDPDRFLITAHVPQEEG